jgi:hypothetical protein
MSVAFVPRHREVFKRLELMLMGLSKTFYTRLAGVGVKGLTMMGVLKSRST